MLLPDTELDDNIKKSLDGLAPLEKLKRGCTERICTLICRALLLLIYVCPLAFQLLDGKGFLNSLTRFLKASTQINYFCIIVCFGIACLGKIAFKGYRLLSWCIPMAIFALASLRSELARNSWAGWKSDLDYSIFQCYLIEVSLLVLLPLQVWLWRHKQDVIEWARTSLCVVAAIQAIVTVIQFVFGYLGKDALLSEWGLASATLYTPRDSTTVYTNASRLTGLTASPIYLGMVMVLSWPALLLNDKYDWTQKFQLSYLCRYGLVALSVVAIILTYTRAAYIALCFQSLILIGYAVHGQFHNRKIPIFNSCVLLCAILIGFAIIPSSMPRISAIADSADASITNRLKVFGISYSLLLERPLSGWGPGFFNVLYNQFYKLPDVDYSFYNIHSGILSFVFEIGCVGFLVSAIAIGGIPRVSIITRMPIWIPMSSVGILIPLMADNPSYDPAFLFPLLWLLGCICVLSIQSDLAYDRRTKAIYGALLVLGFLWFANYIMPITIASLGGVYGK